MIRRLPVLLLTLLFAGAAIPATVHDDFRIIGTLEKHQSSMIAVKKNTGQTVSIRVDKQTQVTQDRKKVDATALKVGQSVVVDAYGDREDDSLAIEIRIVPPIRGGGR
ncbi:MAG TPA: hypothetical protein VI485_33260 [Vicinamibacterales bacterium]|nr:hypothetical protein [Vicinamibacterales bacterium]